jgi:hypothetical protein
VTHSRIHSNHKTPQRRGRCPSAIPPPLSDTAQQLRQWWRRWRRKVRGGGWALKERVATAMCGSGERHEACVFRRGPVALCAAAPPPAPPRVCRPGPLHPPDPPPPSQRGAPPTPAPQPSRTDLWP